MSRLEQLLRYAREEPNDPFNLYAVALEYLKLDSLKAAEFFETLLKDHPNYVATYYTYGKLLHGENHFSRAREIFESGIIRATEKGDAKAIGELKNALSELDFDMEE